MTVLNELLTDTLGGLPNVHACLVRVGERPAVRRGMELPKHKAP